MASHGAEASNEGATPAPANSGAPAPANPPPQDWDSDSFRGPFEGGLRQASFVLQPYDPLEFRLALQVLVVLRKPEAINPCSVL